MLVSPVGIFHLGDLQGLFVDLIRMFQGPKILQTFVLNASEINSNIDLKVVVRLRLIFSSLVLIRHFCSKTGPISLSTPKLGKFNQELWLYMEPVIDQHAGRCLRRSDILRCSTKPSNWKSFDSDIYHFWLSLVWYIFVFQVELSKPFQINLNLHGTTKNQKNENSNDNHLEYFNRTRILHCKLEVRTCFTSA